MTVQTISDTVIDTDLCGIRMANEADLVRQQSNTVQSVVESPAFAAKLLPGAGNPLQSTPMLLRPDASPLPVAREEIVVTDEFEREESLPQLTEEETASLPSSVAEETATEDEEQDESTEQVELEVMEQVYVDDVRAQSPQEPVQKKTEEPKKKHMNRDKEESSEIQVDLAAVNEGKSFKFAIPGCQKSVTLNFSADALLEMKNTVSKTGKNDGNSTEKQGEVSSSTEASSSEPERVSTAAKLRRRCKRKISEPKKASFMCKMCKQSFSTKQLLDRHLPYHVETNTNCGECGKLFLKKWALEEHLAIDHNKGNPVNCKQCDKTFKFERNLLAHIQIYHQDEKRFRCKFCPLTFLQPRSYVNHHRARHGNKPEPWCKVSNILNLTSILTYCKMTT